MKIDTQDIIRYIDIQKKTFKMLPFKSEFNEGLEQGFNLVKLFLKTAEKKEDKMKVLTLQDLKNMKPDTIFAKGESIDSPEGINMTNSGKMLRWIAVRGGIHDWAIYCHFADKDFDWIRKFGDKVHATNHIKKLCPCDDEAFKMYRY